jgi:hypothetical protein
LELIHPFQLQLTGDFDERLRRSVRHLIALNTAEMRREFVFGKTLALGAVTWDAGCGNEFDQPVPGRLRWAMQNN